MKHYITISVIAAAALASCTQTEDFTSQYNEKAKTMKFDVAYVGKNTRAATGELTTENLGSQKLILWCDAYQTSANPTTGIWISSQEPLYLSKSDATYWNVFSDANASTSADVNYPGSTYTTYFTAIAPADEFQESTGTGTQVKYSMVGQYTDEQTSPTFSSRKLTLDNIPVVQQVVNGDNPQGIDYLICCNTSTSEEVSLPFKHLLSKLRFAVWTDENTMNGENPTTKIELNSLKVYLPKDKTAKYVQDAHNDVKGTWTWNDYTAPTDPNPSLTDYDVYTLFDEGTGTPTPKDVKYYADPTTAHESTNWDNVKLDPNFFIAPTGTSTNAKIYIDIKYTVKRKMSDGTWSSSSTQGATGYHVGHKEVTRNNMLVPVGDSSYGHGKETDGDADVERNEGLSHFHQGVLETLYICLRADQKVAFSTNFTVDGWQDDPIDINQK